MKPVRVNTVVVSTQHDDNVKNKEIREGIIEEVIKLFYGDTLAFETIVERLRRLEAEINA